MPGLYPGASAMRCAGCHLRRCSVRPYACTTTITQPLHLPCPHTSLLNRPTTDIPRLPAPAPAASIPVVGFNAVLMSEHFASFFVWMILHLVLLVQWTKALLPDQAFNMAKRLVLSSGLAVVGGLMVMTITFVLRSPTLGWTGGWRAVVWCGVHAGLCLCS